MFKEEGDDEQRENAKVGEPKFEERVAFLHPPDLEVDEVRVDRLRLEDACGLCGEASCWQ